MQQLLVSVFVLFAILPAYGQLNPEKPRRPFSLASEEPLKPKYPSSVLAQWLPLDRQRSYRLSHPVMMQKGHADFVPSNSYWTAYVTTQSFRKGKIGTFYYWDVQGNLRESKLFFNISGKNNRSFKLVFPRL